MNSKPKTAEKTNKTQAWRMRVLSRKEQQAGAVGGVVTEEPFVFDILFIKNHSSRLSKTIYVRNWYCKKKARLAYSPDYDVFIL